MHAKLEQPTQDNHSKSPTILKRPEYYNIADIRNQARQEVQDARAYINPINSSPFNSPKRMPRSLASIEKPYKNR